MFRPKSKRTTKQIGTVKKKTLDGLTANKNIDDIIALSKLSNDQSLEIKSIESNLSGIHSDVTNINNNKQNKLKLTTDGFFGPSTLDNDTLNVPDYSFAPRGLYTQTDRSIPITNTTVETSLVNGGIGTLSVPENTFKVGDSFFAVATGHISSVNNHTLRIKIKANSVVLADTGLITMSATTNKHWKLNIYFTVRTLGGSGTASIVTSGEFTYIKNASSSFEGANFSTETFTGFNTTIQNMLAITAQWGTASTEDIIGTELFTLTKTY